MRIATIPSGAGTALAIERDGQLHAVRGAPTSLLDLICAGPAATSRLAGAAGEPADATPLAPLRPGKVVAIGLNYLDHIREAGMAEPERR
jgi:2-keto-4-pentenoate hydratase/2-oxohepta-3-ene-1,7-dioic acid hydratase in catechol pathway